MRTLNFKEALRQEAEARRILRPVQLLQEAVYGYSYVESGEKCALTTDFGVLAEEYAASYYQAEIDRQKGHDLLQSDGWTIEVKARRLAPDSANSGHFTTIDKLRDKDAKELFVLVYNPVTDSLDGFKYAREEFGDTVTIRWSDSKGQYTEKGGRNNLIQLPSPADITAKALWQILRTRDNERCHKVYGVGIIQMQKALEAVRNV
jgi:hypothetical protein